MQILSEKINLFTRTKEVLSKMKEKESPESYQYLVDNIADDELLEEDPYVIALDLLECDKPEALPKSVRDFIEELLSVAYENGNADAMNDIGAQYYGGSRGFEQDFTKAVNLL